MTGRATFAGHDEQVSEYTIFIDPDEQLFLEAVHYC